MVPHRPPRSGLLLLLLLCLLGGPDRLPTAQSLPGASGGPSPGAPGDGSLPGTGRVKRGWVWNQFFVVEEYTGTEPLYVGKVKAVGERETAPVLDSEPLQGMGDGRGEDGLATGQGSSAHGRLPWRRTWPWQLLEVA